MMRKLPISLTCHRILPRIEDTEDSYGGRSTDKESETAKKPIKNLEEESLEEVEELVWESAEEREEQEQEGG